jgi:fibronectin-binding autotransporter adhesin
VINGGMVQIAGSADRLPTNAVVNLADDPTVLLDLNNTNQTLGSLFGGGSSGGNVTLGTGTLNIAGGGGTYSGVISGGGMVIKSGSGIQMLNGANLYGGGTLVSGGTLVVANTTGSGTGSGGIAVATNGTFQIGDGGADGSVAVGTITNDGWVALNRSDDLTFTTLVTGGGGLVKSGADTVLIPTSNTYTGQTTIYYGALRVSDPGALGTGLTYISTDATARLELTGGITLSQPISVTTKGAASGSAPAMVNVDGTNTLAGPITGLAGGTYWTFEIDAGKLVVTGSFTPSGVTGNRTLRLLGDADGDWWSNIRNIADNSEITVLTKSGAGTWTLWGTNTYTGKTTVSGGRLIVNGALLGSTNITINAGGTLGGSGLITGPVYIGGTLAPGASIGTLTINNSLTLSNGCVAVMEVSHTAYDRVVGLSSVALGGTLQVTVTGTLVGGEAFKLFDSTSYSGDFATYDLPALMSPLSWDTSSVPVDGTLRVAGSIQPQIATMTVTGDHNFQFSGTGPTNWTYWILATTNVTEPVGNWMPVATNTFVDGTFNWTDLHATNYARRFYLLTTEAP